MYIRQIPQRQRRLSNLSNKRLRCRCIKKQPDLMNVRINSTPNKNETRGIDTQKWTWRVYATR